MIIFQIVKPVNEDLNQIENILKEWTDREEVAKYIERIKNEILGKIEFNTGYWIAKEETIVLGITGLSDPLPKIMPFAETDKPAEIKILYVDSNQQTKGVGRSLVSFIESEAVRRGYKELIVRSALRYKNTAWGFYKKMGYKETAELLTNEKEPMQVFEKILVEV
jgi:GNAT superfamily N-acetyltransferase